MQRRTIVLGAAATAVVFPTLAQTSKPTGASPERLTETEERYMRGTEQTGAIALATSRIALQKAQDPHVKQFAQFEVAEQETIAEVLSSMHPSATTGQGSTSGAAPKPDAKGQQLVRKLQDTSSGAEFDREYVRGQMDGHLQLLQTQEQYLKAGHNREALNVAKLARGMIKEHIALLQDISSQLKG